MVLTAGIISLISAGSNSAQFLATQASGGTAPYSLQWYRSTSGTGFIPGPGNIIFGANSLNFKDSNLIPGTKYFYKIVYTDATSATVTSTAFTLTTLPSSISVNSFNTDPFLGETDLKVGPQNVCTVIIDKSQIDPIFAGQPVKFVNSNSRIPSVIAAGTDMPHGYVTYDQKNQSYSAGSRCEIARTLECIWLYSTTPIIRGSQVVLDEFIASGVQQATGNTNLPIIGEAYDQAVESGQLLRIILNVPSFGLDSPSSGPPTTTNTLINNGDNTLTSNVNNVPSTTDIVTSVIVDKPDLNSLTVAVNDVIGLNIRKKLKSKKQENSIQIIEDLQINRVGSSLSISANGQNSPIPAIVQPPIDSPTVGNLMSMDASGINQDSGASITNSPMSNDPTKILTAQAAQSAISMAVASGSTLQGSWDASGGTFPATRTDLSPIMKGDYWVISVAGTLPGSQPVNPGDQILALIDTPAQIPTNWNVSAEKVLDFKGRVGHIVPQAGDYDVSQITGAAPLADPTFTGHVSVPTPTAAADATRKDYVDAGLASKADAAATTAALALKAPLADPMFTGHVSVPTPTAAADATRKDYVDAGLAGKINSTTGNAIQKADGSGGLIAAISGTDYQPIISTPTLDNFVSQTSGGVIKDSGFAPTTSPASNDNTHLPTSAAMQAAISSAIISGSSFRPGGYDASSNLFPSNGGSGSAGAIRAGDFWIITVSGTLGGTPVLQNDSLMALVNAPGQTSTNWVINGAVTKTYVDNQLALKSPLNNPIFSGNVNVPAPSLGSDAANKTYVDTQIATREPTITTLPIAKGGTGQVTANAAFNALAPSQATNANKMMTTDGTNYSLESLLGTLNQVTVTQNAGNKTFSLPQNINSTAAPTFAGVTLSNTPFAASDATRKDYVDGLIAGLAANGFSLRSINYNASTNLFPSSGGSGTAGAVQRGDVYIVGTGGTMPGGQVVVAGDWLTALVNAPGQTTANWNVKGITNSLTLSRLNLNSLVNGISGGIQQICPSPEAPSTQITYTNLTEIILLLSPSNIIGATQYGNSAVGDYILRLVDNSNISNELNIKFCVFANNGTGYNNSRIKIIAVNDSQGIINETNISSYILFRGFYRSTTPNSYIAVTFSTPYSLIYSGSLTFFAYQYSNSFLNENTTLTGLIGSDINTILPTAPADSIFNMKVSYLTSTVSNPQSYVYFPASASNAIFQSIINLLTGVLTANSPASFSNTSPYKLAANRLRNYIYVVHDAGTTLDILKVSSSGTLSSIGTATAPNTATGVVVDPTDRFVYACGFGTGQFGQWTIIKATGLILPIASPPTAAAQMQDLVCHPSGKWLYAINNGNGLVYQYSITQTAGASQGALVALGTPTIAAGSGPIKIICHPNGNNVYVLNNGASTISVFTVNPSTGQLTLSSTFTPAFSGNMQGLCISNNGKFIYYTSQTASTIGQSTLDPTTGNITTPTTSQGVPGARDCCFDFSGTYLFVVNNTNNRIDSFSINISTGVMTSNGNLATGANASNIVAI